MGERGAISRILCPKFGGYLTFAILDGGKASAPGQPTLTDLLNVYNMRNIGCDTKVYGLIGKPVVQSKSPLLHNAAFRSAGINAVYVPLLVDDLADFLNVYSAPDFAGFRFIKFYSKRFLFGLHFVIIFFMGLTVWTALISSFFYAEIYQAFICTW